MTWSVLFDCDGVIVDSEPALAKISAKILQKHGWTARPEDFAPYIGTGEDSYIGNVVRQYNGVFEESIKHEIYDAYIAEADEYVKAFPGGLELIEQLKKNGLISAVASSADIIKVKANLKAVGLAAEDFDALISGDMVERKKPWPDIYLKAAEEAGAVPERSIVVEDATAGVEAGVAAGMVCIGFTSSCSAEQLSAAGAHYVANDFSEISSIISKISGKDLHV